MTDPSDRSDGGGSNAGREPTPIWRMHVWHIQAVRDILFVAGVVALFWAGYALRAVTVPLLVALLLAYLFEPLIRWLSEHPKLNFNRAKAVGTLLATVGVIIVILLALTLPLIVGQTTQFISDVRDGTMRSRIENLQRYIPREQRDEFRSLVEVLPAGRAPAQRTSGAAEDSPPVKQADAAGGAAAGPGDSEGDAATGQPGADPTSAPLTEDRARAIFDERLAEEMERLRDELRSERDNVEPEGAGGLGNLADAARAGMNAIFGVLAATISIGLLAFLIPFYFFFFSLWYPDVVSFGRKLLPDKNKEHTLDLLAKMDGVVAGFVRGRIVISLIMGAMLAIGWMICGVPYALPLGLVVGIFCAVPYLGGIGIPLAIGFLFYAQLGVPEAERMAWWAIILWPTVVFGLVQVIEGYVLIPLIAGKATDLDPVTILVVVLAGGSVMGVYGMLLAIPVAACGKILCTEVVMPNIRKWAKGESADPLPLDPE